MDEEQTNYVISKVTIGNMYSLVYHGLTNKFKLTPAEILIVATIISLSHQKGYCFASEKTIGSMLGISPVTVSTNLTDLKSRNLIIEGKKDEKYKTVHRKIGPEVEDYLEYLKSQIEKGSKRQNSDSGDKDSLNNN